MDNNKRIAIFMNPDLAQMPQDHEVWRRVLHYDQSWCALMPVVEKIESMGYRFKLCRRRAELQKDKWVDPENFFLWEKAETKLASAYQVILKFLDEIEKSNL